MSKFRTFLEGESYHGGKDFALSAHSLEPHLDRDMCNKAAQHFNRFWIDVVLIVPGFGSHSGDHVGIKIASKNRLKNQSNFGSILEGFWLPIWLHFGPILAPKIDQKSRSIFEPILKTQIFLKN